MTQEQEGGEAGEGGEAEMLNKEKKDPVATQPGG